MNKRMKKTWRLKDVIMVSIISVVFALVYLGILYFALFLSSILTPFGLAPLAFEIVFGIWFMAGTLALYIIRKPGVGLVSEMLAALMEVLMGNMYGPMVFIAGFIQGIGAELGFALFRYKKYGWAPLLLGATFSAVFSFGWGFVVSGFFDLKPSLLVLMLITRILSGLLFGGVVTKLLGDRLAQTGVLKSYPIGKDQGLPADEV